MCHSGENDIRYVSYVLGCMVCSEEVYQAPITSKLMTLPNCQKHCCETCKVWRDTTSELAYFVVSVYQHTLPTIHRHLNTLPCPINDTISGKQIGSNFAHQIIWQPKYDELNSNAFFLHCFSTNFDVRQKGLVFLHEENKCLSVVESYGT